MSDLRPTGVPIMIEGVERHLLFTLNADDALQDKLDGSVDGILDLLADRKTATKTLRTVLAVLLEDEAQREKYKDPDSDLKVYTEQELGWIITVQNVQEVILCVLKAYGISLPEPDEFETQKKGRSGQQK